MITLIKGAMYVLKSTLPITLLFWFSEIYEYNIVYFLSNFFDSYTDGQLRKRWFHLVIKIKSCCTIWASVNEYHSLFFDHRYLIADCIMAQCQAVMGILHSMSFIAPSCLRMPMYISAVRWHLGHILQSWSWIYPICRWHSPWCYSTILLPHLSGFEPHAHLQTTTLSPW